MLAGATVLTFSRKQMLPTPASSGKGVEMLFLLGGNSQESDK